MRSALLVMAFVGAAAPIVPLAMVPANVEAEDLGRGYGIVESVFEASEVSLSVLLGVCRALGGFSLALLLLVGSFGLAVLVGLPLLRGAREERPLAEDGLLELILRRACDAGRAALERGRAASKRFFCCCCSPPPAKPGQDGEYVKLEEEVAAYKTGTRAALRFYLMLGAAVVVALVLAPVLMHSYALRLAPLNVEVVGSDGHRDADGVSHSFWSMKPSDPPSYEVAVGTSLVFRYSAAHNVWRMPSKQAFEACDFSGARELASTTHGGVAPADVDRLGYANVYEASMNTASTTYFACQVSDHCQKGQKIAVAVSG